MTESTTLERAPDFPAPKLADLLDAVAPADESEAALLAWMDQALGRLGALEAEAAANRAAAEAEVRLIADRWEAVAVVLAERAEVVRREIAAWLPRLPMHGKKTRLLPTGTVGTRARGAHLFVRDKAAALAWAKRQPNAAADGPGGFVVRQMVESVAQAKLEAHALATGEVPDGCELVAAHEEQRIEPDPRAVALLPARRRPRGAL